MIKNLLRQQLSSVMVATLCSFILGIVSTILFSLVGPALQVILNPEQESVKIIELFGVNLGGFLSWALSLEVVTTESLWLFLPYLLLVFACARGFLTTSTWFLWERASEKMAASLRERLVKAYLHLNPQANFDNEGFDQRLSTILTTDVKLTREYIVHFYGGLPRELFQVAFYLLTLVLLSPQLFAVFVIGIAPAGILVSKLGKKVRRRTAKALDNFSQLSEWLQQRLLGVETIKQYGTERQEVEKLTDLTEKLNYRFLKTIRVKARTAPMMEAIAVSVMVGVLYLALDMVERGVASGSVLMSFFSILGILSQSAAKLGRYYNSNKEGGAAVERILNLQKFMEERQLEAIDFKQHEDENKVVILRDIHLKYPGHESEALKGINLDFEKGKIYCLCGPSGAGKSSLFSILLGLLEPSKGDVSFSRKLNRSSIGYLPQTMTLAPATLGENISYPDLPRDSHSVRKALNAASVGELSTAMKDQSSQGTSNLSGGQLQRLFLARLFYKKFPIILIDEGTSALDPENEAAIYKSIRSLADEGSAVVMIAHRASSMEMADEVLVLDGGELRGRGTLKEIRGQQELADALS